MINLNRKKYPLLFILINISILAIYHFLIKIPLLLKISQRPDPVDILYYSDIFNNLENAIVIFTCVALIFIWSYDYISKWILKHLQMKYLPFYFIMINIILQLVLIFTIKSLPIADSKFYLQHAHSLIASNSYVNEWGNYTAFWPIGLPFLLKLYSFISPDIILVAKLFNIIVCSVYILVIYKLFESELSDKQKILFLIILVLFPNNLFSANIIMGDYIFSLLLWLSVYLTLKHSDKVIYYILTGLMIGVMSYIRPTGLLFPVIIFFVIIKQYKLIKSLKYLVIVTLFTAITLSPWIYRNFLLFHTFVPVSTNGGYNFLMGNHKNATGGLDFTFPYDIKNQNEPEEERLAYRRAFLDMKENSVKTVVRLPKKLIYSFLRGDSSITWALKETENSINPLFKSIVFYSANFLFYNMIIYSLIGFAAKRNVLAKKQIFRYIIYIYIYFIVLILAYVGSERYILTLLPIHFFFAAKNE